MEPAVMKACQEDGVGRVAQEARRNGAVAHLRAQSGQRRGWGGGEFGCGRTQRRCAGVVVYAAGVGRGEMGEDFVDDLGSSSTVSPEVRRLGSNKIMTLGGD